MLVFVSYCLRDVLLVKSLILQLGVLGHNVQFEPKMPAGGIRWKQVLSSIEDCDVFILGLSDYTLQSESRTLELQYAKMLGKPVLPVILSEITGGTPSEFSQALNFAVADKQANTALAQALKALPRSRTGLQAATVPDWRAMLLRIRALVKSPTLSVPEQRRIIANVQELLERQETLRGGQSLLKLFTARKDLDESVRIEAQQTARELQQSYGAQRRARMRNIAIVSVFVMGIIIAGAFLLYRKQANARSLEAAETETVVMFQQNLTLTAVNLQVTTLFEATQHAAASQTPGFTETNTAPTPLTTIQPSATARTPVSTATARPDLTTTNPTDISQTPVSTATARPSLTTVPDQNLTLTAVIVELSATAASLQQPTLSPTPTRTLQPTPHS